MKKMMKFVFLLLLITPIINIKALEVSNNNVKIIAGGTKRVELYANVEEEVKSVTFTLTYNTYDTPSYYEPTTGFTDGNPNGITHPITFAEPKTGKIYLGDVVISTKQYPEARTGGVSINTAKAITVDDETITLDMQNINITITDTEPVEEKKDPNLLDKIESKIVKIELKKDVFEYNVTITNDILELDLAPVAKEEATTIDISSQKIEKDKDNQITITTKNGSTEQEYVINVKVEEKKENTPKTLTANNESNENNSNNNYKTKWIILSVIMAFIIVVGLIFNKKK